MRFTKWRLHQTNQEPGPQINNLSPKNPTIQREHSVLGERASHTYIVVLPLTFCPPPLPCDSSRLRSVSAVSSHTALRFFVAGDLPPNKTPRSVLVTREIGVIRKKVTTKGQLGEGRGGEIDRIPVVGSSQARVAGGEWGGLGAMLSMFFTSWAGKLQSKVT